VALALRAGDAVMNVYREAALASGSSVLLADKQDNSPLTLADVAAHEVIHAGLQQLTPDIPVVSEEDGASAPRGTATGTFWLVDPLDGTREFLARTDEFTVNIALVRDGAPVWGVVVAPALGLVYSGGPGFGAVRRSGRHAMPIHVRPAGGAGACRVVASRSHMDQATAEFIARLGEVELVSTGSSLKFCRVAEGAADVYPRLAPTCEWDTAAGQAVLEGAGGQVRDLAGSPLRYGKADILNPSFVAASAPLASLLPR